MKKMLNIFARPVESRVGGHSHHGFSEPTLHSVRNAFFQPFGSSAAEAARRDEQAAQDATRRKRQEARNEAMDIPSDYAGIVSFFHNVVSRRKSPFNSLVQASERLKDYIPDEISRLKAAYALCADQWQPDVLALAINHHIADVENACAKARESKHLLNAERAQQVQGESAVLRQQNAKLNAEIELLKKSLAQLQEKYDATQARIDTLDGHARLIENDAHSIGFLEQAAENLKNDLQAKKILLGLTI